jgi:hypothetical protein
VRGKKLPLTSGAHLSGGAGARAHSLARPSWAKLVFSFSREFIIAFLFIFSRVLNSNSNQVSNSNQNKHVYQFKEYFGLNMMQQFMTHISFDKNK